MPNPWEGMTGNRSRSSNNERPLRHVEPCAHERVAVVEGKANAGAIFVIKHIDDDGTVKMKAIDAHDLLQTWRGPTRCRC